MLRKTGVKLRTWTSIEHNLWILLQQQLNNKHTKQIDQGYFYHLWSIFFLGREALLLGNSDLTPRMLYLTHGKPMAQQ